MRKIISFYFFFLFIQLNLLQAQNIYRNSKLDLIIDLKNDLKLDESDISDNFGEITFDIYYKNNRIGDLSINYDSTQSQDDDGLKYFSYLKANGPCQTVLHYDEWLFQAKRKYHIKEISGEKGSEVLYKSIESLPDYEDFQEEDVDYSNLYYIHKKSDHCAALKNDEINGLYYNDRYFFDINISLYFRTDDKYLIEIYKRIKFTR